MAGIEKLFGIEKMNILQCEEFAKKSGQYNSMEFFLCGPKGKLKAKWLDAYYGFFQIEGQDGFLRAQEFAFNPTVWCEIGEIMEQLPDPPEEEG